MEGICERIPAFAGGGSSRDHHQRRHPRRIAALARPPPVLAGPDPRRARPLSRVLRPRASGHLAAGVRLPVEGLEEVLRGSRVFCAGSCSHTHGLLQARPQAPVTRCSPRCSPPRPWRPSAATTTPPNRCGAGTKAIPAKSFTGIFTATSGLILSSSYLSPYLPAAGPPQLHRPQILSHHRPRTAGKAVYDRQAALNAADQHAQHFLEGRARQITRAAVVLGRPPRRRCPL